MSNCTNRPANQHPAPSVSTDRPTATYPTADHLARLEREEAAHRERLADLWADRTPTEELPVVPDRPAARQPRPSRARRHLRAALAGVLAASALLTGLSLYAADGISSARQAAIEQARSQAAQPAPQPAPAPPPPPPQRAPPAHAPWARPGPPPPPPPPRSPSGPSTAPTPPTTAPTRRRPRSTCPAARPLRTPRCPVWPTFPTIPTTSRCSRRTPP